MSGLSPLQRQEIRLLAAGMSTAREAIFRATLGCLLREAGARATDAAIADAIRRAVDAATLQDA